MRSVMVCTSASIALQNALAASDTQIESHCWVQQNESDAQTLAATLSVAVGVHVIMDVDAPSATPGVQASCASGQAGGLAGGQPIDSQMQSLNAPVGIIRSLMASPMSRHSISELISPASLAATTAA